MSENPDKAPHQTFKCPTEGRTTSIEAQLDPISGSYVILWQRIQLSFKNVQYLRHGTKEVHREVDPDTLKELNPPRVRYHPGVTLQVVQDPVAQDTPFHIPQATTKRAALSLPRSIEIQSPRPQSVALLEGTNFGKSLVRLSQHIPPNGQAAIGTYSGLLESYVGALMTGQHKQMESIKAHMTTTITSLEKELSVQRKEAEKYHAELTRNQMTMLQNDLEAKAAGEKLLLMQIRLHDMQNETLTRLAAIYNRIQAVLVQTYELLEYPIPRLFIVLPVEPDLWDKLNPFTHKFRLYFLCECGEHSMKTAAGDKSHVVHLAKHQGYDLLRPTEFFDKYGPYLLTMLDMVKYGVTTAGIIVPSLATLGILDGIKEIEGIFKFSKEMFGPLLDESITYVKDKIGHLYSKDDASGEENHEVLEGASLRQLASYLVKADEDKTLGNLYRTVTDKGHVKWVCLDHYRAGYLASLTRRCSDVVALNGGDFNEQLGKIKVALSTPLTAQQFYDSLRGARGVSELYVWLAWDASKADLQAFCTAILQSNISILTLVGESFSRPVRDALNWNTRFNAVMQLVASGKLQSLTVKGCRLFLERVSRSGKWSSSSLRILRLECDVHGREKESQTTQANMLNLCTWFPNLIELVISCYDIDKTFSNLQEPLRKLRQLSTLTLCKTPRMEYVLFKVADGLASASEVAVANLSCTRHMFSGTVERLHLRHPWHNFDLEQILRSNKSLSAVSLHGDLTGLWEVVRTFDSIVIGRSQPLSLSISSQATLGNMALIEYRDPGRIYNETPKGIRVQGWKATMFIQHWSVCNIKMIVDDLSAAVLEMVAERFLRSHPESHLDLDISGLTTRSLGSLQRTLQLISPKRLTLISRKSEGMTTARCFCSGLTPNVWCNLTTLSLTFNNGQWIESFNQLPASYWNVLEGLSLTSTETHTSISGLFVQWIVSIVSSRKLGQSLQWLELKNISLQADNWMQLINMINFATLWRLEMPGCNLEHAHIMRLTARICKPMGLRHLNLRRIGLTTRARTGLGALKLENLEVDIDIDAMDENFGGILVSR
ncbi:hypothetical protein BGZ68_010765, partial [Mortierella alpina]